VLHVLAAGGLRPDPDQGREWLRHELTHQEYHQQSLLERLLSFLKDLFDKFTHAASGATPLSTLAAIVVAIALIGLLIYVLPRVRHTPAARGLERVVLTQGDVTAVELRARAEQAFREGRPEAAVGDAYRALARRMVERGTIEQTVGSTAHELAERLVLRFPDHTDRLVRSANLFDSVVYGEHRASSGDAELVLRLDDELRHTRPVDDARLRGPALVVPFGGAQEPPR
jgi:hypothetical protein